MAYLEFAFTCNLFWMIFLWGWEGGGRQGREFGSIFWEL